MDAVDSMLAGLHQLRARLVSEIRASMTRPRPERMPCWPGCASRAMSIDLVVEVLDHYHGPHSRKLWLLAWAEKVPRGRAPGTASVRCSRPGSDVSMSRVSGIARELEDEGMHQAARRRASGARPRCLELSPLDHAQGQPRADPMQGQPRADPSRVSRNHRDRVEPRSRTTGSARADAQGQPRADPNPHNPHNRSTEPSSARARGRAARPTAPAPDPSRVDATDQEIETILGQAQDGSRATVTRPGT